MIYKVLGIEVVDYVSKKTGNRIVGRNLHVCCDFGSKQIERGCQGYRTESVYIKNDMCPDLKVGDQVEFLYNRYGSVEEMKML